MERRALMAGIRRTSLVLLLVMMIASFITLVNAGRSHRNANHKQTPSLSKQLNKNVQDLYNKAEQLQDRAFQRVYELQERAQQLQDKAFTRANELEVKSQAIMEQATRQAKILQHEAAQNLGELTSVIESLPIPSVDDNDESIVQTKEVIEDSGNVEVEIEFQNEEVGVVHEEPVPETTVVVKNKWQNVRERTLPAVLMLGGLAAYIHYGGSFLPLIFFIQIGLFAETASVVNIRGMSKWWWFLAAVAGTNGHFLQWKYTEAISYGMAVMGLVSFIIAQNRAKGGGALLFRAHLQTLAAIALSLLILVGQSSFWIATLQDYGLMWILYPALLVIVNDTMAYVFGMLFGKHALLPVISPKKTWQGFIGATLATMGVSVPLYQNLISSSDDVWMHALAMATYISLVSPFGGFLASIVKRAHGKKDFANWIPGHGGVVDRLDCQVITAPFVYFYLSTFLTTATQSPSP